MRILIIEDNLKLAKYVKMALESESYSVDTAYDGETGEKQAFYREYDAIILDLTLPLKDGLSICRELRKKGNNTPVMMLTARSELEDKIEGLDSGADDYLAKPFELPELLARVRALIRRPRDFKSENSAHLNLKMEHSSHKTLLSGKEIHLTLKEYSVLEYLLINKGKVLTRIQILEHCWDYDYDFNSNIVDVYIKRLREKLKDEDEKYIKTVRGLGYRIQD